MTTQNLYIKNMVCPRCERVVKEELENIGLTVKHITLGEAIIECNEPVERRKIATTLKDAGFELIEDKIVTLVEKIKVSIIEHVHHGKKQTNQNFSQVLAKEIGKDYSYISKVFSEVENISIEKYIINQKIERVKELLIYNEMTLSEIAWNMDYSSVSHLSSQFKQVTGMTPTAFKQSKGNRKHLDQL